MSEPEPEPNLIVVGLLVGGFVLALVGLWPAALLLVVVVLLLA